jgi:hypothetical protein
MSTRGSGFGSRGSEMGNDPTAPDLLAAPDNLAGSAPTPDSRHATPSETPDTRQPTPAEPNWPLLYGIVLSELVILIFAFYTFTKAFA